MEKRVVIALCYEGINKYYLIPECPFCFTPHRHRLSSTPSLKTDSTNGQYVLYQEGMITKISDCRGPSGIYALELREKKEFDFKKKSTCHGKTIRGIKCKKLVKIDNTVCIFHANQLNEVISNRIEQLTTST